MVFARPQHSSYFPVLLTESALEKNGIEVYSKPLICKVGIYLHNYN